jgi:hypothetical protein
MHQIRGLFLQSLLLIWLGLAGYRLASAQSQSCPLITIDDLGSTTEFSSNGLIARGIVPPGESGLNVPVRIRNFTIVCDAAGDRINTSSFVSVVVEFHCNFASAQTSLAVCNDTDNVVTRQYQFQCIEQNGQPTWDTTVSSSSLFIQTLNPNATLSTPLNNQCRRCIDDQQSTNRPSIDPTTHCDRESSYSYTLLVKLYLCTHNITIACQPPCDQGLGRCYLRPSDICCNFYLQNNCTEECPSALVNDSNSVCGEFQYLILSCWKTQISLLCRCTCTHACTYTHTYMYMHTHIHAVCPSLSLDNGDVRYSLASRDIGSVATYTCDPGYRSSSPQAGMTRTCSVNGWSDLNFTCEQCEDIITILGHFNLYCCFTGRPTL